MRHYQGSDRRVVSRLVSVMLLAGLLAACASQPESREAIYEQAEENTEQTPAAVEPEQPEPGQRQASNSLLTEARLARATAEHVVHPCRSKSSL